MTHPAPSLRATLRCHVATPSRVKLSVTADVQAQADALRLRYTLRGDTRLLRVPAPTAPVPTDGLWRHTCFEAFVAADDEPAYREFNFSPSSAWAAYRFASERQRDPNAEAREPVLLRPPQVTVTPQAITLTVRVPATALPRSPAVLSLGLCAVIEELDGHLSYWALHHPAAHADFHHRDGRTLRLAAPLS